VAKAIRLQVRFGEIIRARRLLAGMTQESLALEAGVSTYYVRLIEGGKKSPSLRVVESLAGALRTTVTDLIAEAETIRD